MEQYTLEPELRWGSSTKIGVYTEISSGKKIAVKETSREEASIFPRLNHPNIVKCIRSYEQNGKPYVVMDYMERGDLKKFMGSNTITEPQIAKVMYSLLSAVAYIHEMNIVHKDIKPENVMMDADDSAKLCDFGISEQLESQDSFSKKIGGTSGYLSPDLALMGRYNTKADIWSLGIVLYEMCFHQLPFKNYAQAMRGTFEPFPEKSNKTFCRMVTLMLQKDPNTRPTARELITLLNREFGIITGSLVWSIKGEDLEVTEEGVTTKYLSEGIIGRGQYGEVRLLVDEANKREIILKTSNKIVSSNFQREVYAMRQLEHPNIVEFVGAFEDNQNVHLVMEYANGGDLEGKLKKGPLELGEAVQIFHQLLQAVAYMHERSIVHKDIKPANILLDSEGKVKLGDFGTAKQLEGAELGTTMVYTMEYAAPELFETGSYDSKFDIWSCGIVLFEMCTGKLPFKTQDERMSANLNIPTAVNKVLRRLIVKMLERNPRKRPEAVQLLASLNNEFQNQVNEVRWGISFGGKLKVNGDGPMELCYLKNLPPWEGRKGTIKSVAISKGVTSTGSSAFSGCKDLKSVSIPSSAISINRCAFFGSGLVEIQIPTSVTSICDYAFAGTAIKRAALPPKLVDISNGAFCECRNLVEVTMPMNVRTIGDYAFFECFKLSSINIPRKLQSVGEQAFSRCQLLAVPVLDADCVIGNDAFFNCLERVVPDKHSDQDDSPNVFGAIFGAISDGFESLSESIKSRFRAEPKIERVGWKPISRDETLKIVVVGGENVGKTTLAERLAGNRERERSPLGAEIYDGFHEYKGNEYHLQIWDVVGFSPKCTVNPGLFEDTRVGIIVISCDDINSISDLDICYLHLRRTSKIVLVNNKIDLERAFKKDDVMPFFAQGGYCEVSAVSGEGIDELWRIIFE